MHSSFLPESRSWCVSPAPSPTSSDLGVAYLSILQPLLLLLLAVKMLDRAARIQVSTQASVRTSLAVQDVLRSIPSCPPVTHSHILSLSATTLGHGMLSSSCGTGPFPVHLDVFYFSENITDVYFIAYMEWL